MLPHGTLSSRGDYHFKMNEMASNDERMERVPGFYDVIQNHTLALVSFFFRPSDLVDARSRVMAIPLIKIDFGFFENNYKFAFFGLIHSLHNQRDVFFNAIGADEKIDLYFDERGEKRSIHEIWDRFLESQPDIVRNRYGNEPIFEKDEEFLPLQAADALAWWARDRYVKGSKVPAFLSFPFVQSVKKPIIVEYSMNADDVLDWVGSTAAAHAESIGGTAIDIRTGRQFSSLEYRQKKRKLSLQLHR